MQEVCLKKKRPEACSSQEITEFMNLILKGNQVQKEGLRDLVMDAQWLGFARLDGSLVSVAAVKAPAGGLPRQSVSARGFSGELY